MSSKAPRAAPRPQPACPVVIAQAGADDLDLVMEIMNAAFAPSFGEAWTRSQCAGILPMAGVELRLARGGGGVPNGFALLRTVADEAELLLIAVDPLAQHRGVGRALLDDFVMLATGRGADRLHLEVRDGNPAIALYESVGFKLAGRRRNYYHGPAGATCDALTLARDA